MIDRAKGLGLMPLHLLKKPSTSREEEKIPLDKSPRHPSQPNHLEFATERGENDSFKPQNLSRKTIGRNTRAWHCVPYDLTA